MQHGKIEILHFDKDVIVCIKPVGILSQGDASGNLNLPDVLKKQTNSYYVEVVHRLDRPVGGVMVFARNKKAAAKLTEDVKNRNFGKEYYAIVSGRPEQDSGTLTDWLFKDKINCKSFVVKSERKGAKEAILDYETLNSKETKDGLLSKIKIRLHTGRTHQIRVQFSSRKMPLVGDGKYGSKINCGLALWSHKIAFTHPKTKQLMEFTAEPPTSYPWNQF